MNVTRRTVLRGAAAAAALAIPVRGAFAQKAEFTYKYANNLPLTHPMNQRAKEMTDAIRAETKGRVDIQIFPNNQLGSDTDVLSQLRSGGVEFFTLSGLILSTLVPASSISGMGFAFNDYPSVWKAMDGDLGAYIRGQIAKANIVAMDKIWDNGFRQITSSTKPIAAPADLKGFKIRVPVSPLWTSMFKALDASPASINFDGGLLGTADEDRRRPGEPAGNHLDGEALRSAEVLLADEPHVGRILVPRQPPCLGDAAGRPAGDRREAHQRRGPSRSVPTSPS